MLSYKRNNTVLHPGWSDGNIYLLKEKHLLPGERLPDLRNQKKENKQEH